MPRPGAAFLEDQIDLICNPDHYRTLFAEALEGAFGAGGDRLRVMLGRVPKRPAVEKVCRPTRELLGAKAKSRYSRYANIHRHHGCA